MFVRRGAAIAAPDSYQGIAGQMPEFDSYQGIALAMPKVFKSTAPSGAA
jgi:hypothetical protein